MLVTSTAIKAVENIIDDLRSDPATRDLDWLWFHSGSNEQVQYELTRRATDQPLAAGKL